ncbi:hypothetical protein SB784_34410, partial [Burkholderia sp. SIMBA_048]
MSDTTWQTIDTSTPRERVHADRIAPSLYYDPNLFEAELERLREAAHAQGIASGHVAGQALGYQAGYDQGHAQGFEQGQSEAREQAAQLAAL